jgi:PAS domain S-box-containing protein
MSTSRAHGAFDLVRAFVAELDGQARIVGWNRACEELTGRSSAEVVGARLSDFAVDEVNDEVNHERGGDLEQRIAELREGVPSIRFEVRFRASDGGHRHLAWTAVASRCPDGGIDGFVATGVDVSAERLAEETLRAHLTESDELMAAFYDAVVSVDVDQRILRFNRGAERAFGYVEEEVLGRPLDVLVPERFREEHRRQVDAFAVGSVIAQRMGPCGSVPALRKNGEEFLVDAGISKRVIGGKTTMTAVLRDMSQREQLERDQTFLIEAGKILASSLDYEKTLSEVAELAVQQLADCCFVDMLDAKGRARRIRVAAADPAKAAITERLTAYPTTRSGALPFGRRALESGAGVLVPEVPPGFIASIAENEEHLSLLRELAPRSYIAAPLFVEKRLLGAVVFISCGRRYAEEDLRVAADLTSRAARAIENARLHSEAQRAIRARDAMLGIVAHDLRNPLQAIVLSTTMVSRKLAKEPSLDAARHGLEAVLHSARRANRLIADLLDVTRIEAGTLSMDPKPCSAGVLLRSAIESARPLLEAFEVVTDVPEDLPEIYADPDRIMQVFANLISNAAKFTPPSGRITIGAVAGPTAVTFRVADSGCGIAVELQPHLFDRFWRADAKDPRGTGLGLPIAKGIVEDHGGQMRVESAAGVGSTFSFDIPLASPASARRPSVGPEVALDQPQPAEARARGAGGR